MRKRTLLVACALLLAACGGGSSKQTLTGSFTLDDDDIAGSWTSCSGRGGYSDFGSGMNVTVRDGAGTIIATTSTRNLADDDLEADGGLGVMATLAELIGNDGCTVWFETEVARVDFYEVEIGRRGGLTYSLDEMKDADWHVDLTLGG